MLRSWDFASSRKLASVKDSWKIAAYHQAVVDAQPREQVPEREGALEGSLGIAASGALQGRFPAA